MSTHWSCSACTFLNTNDRTMCEICNSRKPGSAPARPRLVQDLSDLTDLILSDSDEEIWSCHICTYLNSSDASQCAMCGQKASSIVCQTCNEINDTESDSFNMLCKSCNAVLVMSDEHKKMDENTKLFLRNCINFKSAKQNAILLLCGYIREANVCNFPFDITQLCIEHCYSLDCLSETDSNKCEWDQTHIQSLNSLENTVVFAQNKDILSLVKTNNWNKPQTAFIKGEIDSKVIRKVWKIKILRKFSHNNCYTFKIGLMDTVGKGKNDKYQISLMEVCRNGVCNGQNIQFGDVISILLVNFGAFARLVFGINGQIIKCGNKFEEISMVHKYKFAVTMTQREEIQLLQ